MRWGHGSVRSKQGRKAGKAESIVTSSNKFRWRHLPDATPTTLDDIPVTWASTPARNLVPHLRIA
ncbi:hypothetical protein ACLK1S_10160 [Escherichia coli]